MVLGKAVYLGRTTFGNTMKYIKMAVSSNFGNVFSVLIASAWLPFLPMQPIHLLSQNLLYDFSQIAIPWDKCDPDFLQTPKTWSAKSIVRFMVCLGPLSSIFDMTTFAFMWFYFGIQTADDPAKVSLFQTAWFVEGLLTQTSIVHMIRTDKLPFIQSNASIQLYFGTILCMMVGVAIPFTPLGTVLSMEPLPAIYFAYLFSAIFGYFIVSQVGKKIFIHVFHDWV